MPSSTTTRGVKKAAPRTNPKKEKKPVARHTPLTRTDHLALTLKELRQADRELERSKAKVDAHLERAEAALKQVDGRAVRYHVEVRDALFEARDGISEARACSSRLGRAVRSAQVAAGTALQRDRVARPTLTTKAS